MPPSPTRTRTREERTQRNLNVILYFAGVLFIAAAAALIGANLPASFRMILLCAIVGLFSAAGILLHVCVHRLRPTAVAFAGTGLAITPFVGVALHTIQGLPAPQSWLIASVGGLALAVVFTAVLRNQVVAWLLPAFILSLTCSFIANADIAITWYFVCGILLSTVCGLLAGRGSGQIAELIRKPVVMTGHILTPAALVGSLVFFRDESASADFLHSATFGLAALHYLLAFQRERRQGKGWYYETAFRILAQIALVFIANDVLEHTASSYDRALRSIAFGWSIVASALLQILYGLLRNRGTATRRKPSAPAQNQDQGSAQAQDQPPPQAQAQSQSQIPEWIWDAVMLLVILAANACWVQTDEIEWRLSMTHTGISFVVILATSACLAFLQKAANWHFVSCSAAYFALYSLLHEAGGADWRTMAYVHLPLAAIALAVLASRWGRTHRPLLTLQFFLALTLSVLYALAAGDTLLCGILFAAAALLVLLYSYLAKQPYAEIGACITLFAALSAFALELVWENDSVDLSDWMPFVLCTVSCAIFAVTATVHRLRGEQGRVRVASIFAVAVLLPLLPLNALSFLFMGDTAIALPHALSIALLLILSAALVSCAFLVKPDEPDGLDEPNKPNEPGRSGKARRRFILWSAPVLAIEGALLATSHEGLGQFAHAGAWLFCALLLMTLARRLQALAPEFIAHASLFIAASLFAEEALFAMGPYAPADLLPFALAVTLWGLVCLGLFAASRAQKRYSPLPGNVYLVAGLACLTVGTGGQALWAEGIYQVVFLVLMLAILVMGALTQRAWALVWGVTGASIAILYFLKAWMWAMFLFLGLLLTALAVWRLLVIGRRKKRPVPSSGSSDPSSPSDPLPTKENAGNPAAPTKSAD
jgi:hypothetical protein